MRTVKIAVWIAVLYLLQTVFGRLISVYGITPQLLTAFAVLFPFISEDDKESAYTALVCAALSGAMVGHYFAADMIVIGVAYLISHFAVQNIRFVPSWIRAHTMTALAAFVYAAVVCFSAKMSVNGFDIRRYILPNVIYTLICSFVMYPIIKKTLFGKADKVLWGMRKEPEQYEQQ